MGADNPVQVARMNVDEFLAWSLDQPGRYELVDGEVVAMSPRRVRHAEAKAAVFLTLRAGIDRAGVACRAMPDGMTVRIDATTAYEPDALVYRGPRLPDDAVEVEQPVILVEVLSPGTRTVDTGRKFAGYFSLSTVSHYLIVDPQRRVVIHHERDGQRGVRSRIASDGCLVLDPPGLAVAVADLLSRD